jgi:hypothetical protein
MMHVAIVQVVGMSVVLHRRMAAVLAMLMAVTSGVLLVSRRHISSFPNAASANHIAMDRPQLMESTDADFRPVIQ